MVDFPFPENPDPSKIAILRTWTPAIKVQTLPLEGPRILRVATLACQNEVTNFIFECVAVHNVTQFLGLHGQLPIGITRRLSWKQQENYLKTPRLVNYYKKWCFGKCNSFKQFKVWYFLLVYITLTAPPSQDAGSWQMKV